MANCVSIFAHCAAEAVLKSLGEKPFLHREFLHSETVLYSSVSTAALCTLHTEEAGVSCSGERQRRERTGAKKNAARFACDDLLIMPYPLSAHFYIFIHNVAP